MKIRLDCVVDGDTCFHDSQYITAWQRAPALPDHDQLTPWDGAAVGNRWMRKIEPSLGMKPIEREQRLLDGWPGGLHGWLVTISHADPDLPEEYQSRQHNGEVILLGFNTPDEVDKIVADLKEAGVKEVKGSWTLPPRERLMARMEATGGNGTSLAVLLWYAARDLGEMVPELIIDIVKHEAHGAFLWQRMGITPDRNPVFVKHMPKVLAIPLTAIAEAVSDGVVNHTLRNLARLHRELDNNFVDLGARTFLDVQRDGAGKPKIATIKSS